MLANILGLLVFFFFPASPPQVFAEPSVVCSQNLERLYFTYRNIKHSRFSPHKQNRKFLDWSALQSNKVMENHVKGKSSGEILSEVAQSRGLLQQELTKSEQRPDGIADDEWVGRFTRAGRFGVYRETVGLETPYRLDFLKRLAPSRRFVANLLRERLPTFDTPKNKWPEFDAYYRTENGKLVRGCFVEVRKRAKMFTTEIEMIITHPAGASLKAIMDSVHRRIETARRSTNLEQKKLELAHAIFGSYQATPYERGSASILGSFWRGLLSAELGKKVEIPDGIDYRAFLMEQDKFVQWLITKL